MLVQHSCDNKLCVNPDHLVLGTDATNHKDKQLKGRAAKKLTVDDVKWLRAELEDGRSQNAVARDLGVARATVQRAADGRYWGHV